MKIKDEINLCSSKKEALTKICIAYPNNSCIAMSNLGFISTFYLLTSHPLALGERVFLPSQKEVLQLKKRKAALSSVETGKAVFTFDILAFSISFENDYINVLKILDLATIPTFAKDRDEKHPLVIGGGIATILNPEPIADFFDAFLLGDSADMINEFIDVYTKYKGKITKKKLLKKLSKIKGVYVPSLYTVKYNDDGTISEFVPEPGIKNNVIINMADDLTALPAFSYIISKEALFRDMFLLEISRGCTRLCRFCAAGFNYLPYKKLDLETVKEIILTKSSGKKVGLVGAAVSDYKEIDELCEFLCDEKRAFSVSSFRADSLSDTLLSSLKESGHKTLTIAPEAGSKRMRDIISKGVTEDDIINAARKIAESGILNVKLYYIIGLPFETQKDIAAIVDLTKKVRDIFLSTSKKLKRVGNVTVSIHPFIPKARTPFFFMGMAPQAELKEKARFITKSLKKEPNIVLEQIPLKEAVLESLLARGDRRVSSVIKRMAEGESLKKSVQKEKLDLDFYVTRDIPVDEILPFDIMKTKMKKDFLISELNKAKEIANLQ